EVAVRRQGERLTGRAQPARHARERRHGLRRIHAVLMVQSGSAKGTGFGMRLTTWPEVHRHLAATYADVRAERDGVLDIVVPLRDAAAPATPGAAPLAVSRTEVLGSTWIDVSSVIGSLRHLSQAEILPHNA